jgi:MFS family permease
LVRQPFLRTAVLLVSVANVLFNALRLTVVVIINEDGGSPALVGIIGMVSGVGGVLGALCGPIVVRRLHPGTIIIGVFAVWAVVMPLVAFTTEPVVLSILLAVMVFAGALINVIAGTYQVQVIPDELQGRVGSVASLLSSGANSLGPLAAGLLLGPLGELSGLADPFMAGIVPGVVVLALVQHTNAEPACLLDLRPQSPRGPDGDADQCWPQREGDEGRRSSR